jgi:tetratricopeptide (TPR) repeat protein
MKSRPLKKAARLFRARKYPSVISLLEPQVFMYRENAQFFYMLGVSCLHTGDYGGAHSYLQRSAQLSEDDIDALVGLAAVHIKRRENQEALRLWLEVLDRSPNHRVARRGLSLLQKTDDPSVLSEELSDRRIKRLFPSSGFHVPGVVWVGAAVTVVAVMGVLFGPSVIREVRNYLEDRRPGYEVLQTEDQPTLMTAAEGEFRYILTAREIEAIYDRIGRLFNDFRDNLARREINRLLASNASQAIKQRLRLLLAYIAVPDFTNFRDNFEYGEVAAEPWLYEGCFVRWKGRATNVRVAEDAITFDFLVGYHTEQVLEGIVEARLSFAARVDPGDPIEIIGRIVDVREDISVQVMSLRKLAPGTSS